MTLPAHRIQYSLAEYVALERSSNVKHEYFEGQIFAMAGGTPEHAALAAAVIGLLFPQLSGGRCRVFDADLRIRIEASGLSTYPDVAVVCGPRETSTADQHAVTNPTVLFEVTSPTSDSYDRGDKREHYQLLDSLRGYVVIAQAERRVDVWSRGPDDAWQLATYRSGDAFSLESLEATLRVDDLYDAATDPHA